MKPRSHPNIHAIGAAAILGVAIACEASHLVWPWPGVGATHSRVVSSILITFWSLSMVVVLARHAARPLARMTWLVTLAAPFSMLFHTLVSHVMTGSYVGLVYAPLALALIFYEKRLYHDEPRLGMSPMTPTPARHVP